MLCKDMQGVRARGPTDRGGGASVRRSFGKIDCLTSTSVSPKAFCSSTLKLGLLAWFLGVGCWILSAPTAQRAASQRLDLFPRADQSDLSEGQVWKSCGFLQGDKGNIGVGEFSSGRPRVTI